jgi:hypothetical protein
VYRVNNIMTRNTFFSKINISSLLHPPHSVPSESPTAAPTESPTEPPTRSPTKSPSAGAYCLGFPEGGMLVSPWEGDMVLR